MLKADKEGHTAQHRDGRVASRVNRKLDLAQVPACRSEDTTMHIRMTVMLVQGGQVDKAIIRFHFEASDSNQGAGAKVTAPTVK